MAYTNRDGLVILYAPEDSSTAQGGQRSQVDGPLTKVEFEIKGTEVTASNANPMLLKNVRIPKNALIQTATLYVKTAFTSGGSATLDVGLAQKDGTEIDFDGLFASQALSGINAQGKSPAGAGALVKGTALAADGYLSVKYGTAAFTAGQATLVVEYLLP